MAKKKPAARKASKPKKCCTKAALITAAAKDAGVSRKAAATVVDSVIAGIHAALKARKPVRITGLGSFRAKHVKARKVVGGKRLVFGKMVTVRAKTIPAKTVPKFRPGKAFKLAVK